MKRNVRMFALIKLLSTSNAPMNSSAICDKLRIRSRTLRDDLSKYKELFTKNGIEIISKHGVGYSIKIIDEDKYYGFMRELLKEETMNQCLIPEVPEERIAYLIRLFLISNDYLKIEQIAESIFVSHSTLNNDLKEVKNRLKYFHLELDSKPYYGVKIIGDEFHIRSCMAKYFFHTDTTDQQFMQKDIENEDQRKIRDILYNTLYESRLKLTDIGFQNLVVHISIAILRNNQTRVDEESDVSVFRKLEDKKEYLVAIELAEKLQEAFSINFPKIEIYYLTIHLLGKKTFEYNSKKNFVITEDIEKLFERIFIKLNKEYHIDFSDDFELYTLLALHFQPMLDRLQYRLSIENPVLDQIKEDNILAFNIAVSAGMIIEEYTGFPVNENELGYMALHFALACERKKQGADKKNIIIVCASGAGSSQILLYKIKQKFGRLLDKIYVTPLYELETLNQEEYDFILSTIPISLKTSIPVLQVQYFLTDQNFRQIGDVIKRTANSDFVDKYFRDELFFADLEAKSRNAIIAQLCEKIRLTMELPEEFEDLVLQREAVSSTELGNYVAFPHPVRAVGEQTFVAVAVLPRTIKWDKKHVKYIFLLCIKKEEQLSLTKLYDTLTDLFYHSDHLELLGKKPTIATLKLLLDETVKNELHEEESDDIFR